MKRGREAIIELWSLGHTSGVRVDGTSSPCDCPTACGGRWYAVPKVERVLKVLKFDAPSARGVVAASPQILKNAFLSSLLLAHPHSGGGWRVQRDGRGAASPWATLWPGFRGFRPPSGSAPGGPDSAREWLSSPERKRCTTRRRQAATTLRLQPRQPAHRRCVQG